MKGNPQIEDGYTRIANELLEALTKAMASGLITGKERAIIDYVIRHTYGFQKTNGYFKPANISKELGIERHYVSYLISNLIKKNILKREDDRLGINKHYKEWKRYEISKHVMNNHNVSIKKQDRERVSSDVTNNHNVMNNRNNVKNNHNDVMNNHNIHLKEKQSTKRKAGPLKKSLKKTYKEKNNTSTNVDVDAKKPNPVYQLVEDFALFRNIPLDRGFINKNVQHAKRLLKQYPPEFIAQVIKWRLEHDDGFWHSKLNNLGIVYTHIAEWIGEMKRGKKIISFKKFLEQNPHLDYRQLEKGSKEREIALWRALREAYKSGYVEFTPKMLEVYKSFIEDFERRKS